MIETSGQDDLSRQLRQVRAELEAQFRSSSWTELARALTAVASLGQAQGQRELCLRAQSLRELMGVRDGGGRGPAPGVRVREHFQDLLFHLTHLEWTLQSGAGRWTPPGGASIESAGPLV